MKRLAPIVATVEFTGQDSMRHAFKPLLEAKGCKKARKGKAGKRQAAGAAVRRSCG